MTRKWYDCIAFTPKSVRCEMCQLQFTHPKEFETSAEWLSYLDRHKRDCEELHKVQNLQKRIKELEDMVILLEMDLLKLFELTDLNEPFKTSSENIRKRFLDRSEYKSLASFAVHLKNMENQNE